VYNVATILNVIMSNSFRHCSLFTHVSAAPSPVVRLTRDVILAFQVFCSVKNIVVFRDHLCYRIFALLEAVALPLCQQESNLEYSAEHTKWSSYAAYLKKAADFLSKSGCEELMFASSFRTLFPAYLHISY
jgi:hypothetical protein